MNEEKLNCINDAYFRHKLSGNSCYARVFGILQEKNFGLINLEGKLNVKAISQWYNKSVLLIFLQDIRIIDIF